MVKTIFKILLTHLTMVKFDYKLMSLGKVVDDDMGGQMKAPINWIFNNVSYKGDVLTQTYNELFSPVHDNIFLSLLNSRGFVEDGLNGKVYFSEISSELIDKFMTLQYCKFIAEGFETK